MKSGGPITPQVSSKLLIRELAGGGALFSTLANCFFSVFTATPLSGLPD
jgi:hypothetical protein